MTSAGPALIDAVERLLVSTGHASVSTRRIAEEAGQPHCLVRYHFGTLDGLMLRTLDRASAQILQRQRALYEGPEPFVDKWRTAMSFLAVDLEAGFPKLLLELMAKAWNELEYRSDLRRTMDEFTTMLTGAVVGGAADFGLALDENEVLAFATLIRTFQIGMLVERLADIDIDHEQLLVTIEEWLVTRAENTANPPGRPASPHQEPGEDAAP